MSYILEAFIGKSDELKIIQDIYSEASLIALEQDFSIIPMTDALYAQISENKMLDRWDRFNYFNIELEEKILKLIEFRSIGYFEVEYFNDQGGQLAILWQNGQRMRFYEFNHHAVDDLLRDLGVIAEATKDEFDTLHLGKHRKTIDWIQKNKT